MSTAVWHIEYTNNPLVRKARRKVLEREVVKALRQIEGLLESKENDGFMLEDSDFGVESTWVESVQKHHISVYDLKGEGSRWVASIISEEHPTMNVEEVKSYLRSLGLSEYSIHALGMTNKETVGEFLEELRGKTERADTEDYVKIFDLAITGFLEGFLEQGVVRLSDGLLDALVKIDPHIR